MPDGSSTWFPFDISSIVVAAIGAVLTVVVVNMVTGRSRSGRGAV